MREAELIERINEEVSDEDRARESTLQSVEEVATLLSPLQKQNLEKMAALGIGHGALPASIARAYDIINIHGIDVDDECRQVASEHGISTYDVDVEVETLPFENGEIDLVVSFGLLEHLTWYDNVLSETNRVLRDGGYALFAMPNMAGWTNRLSLLTGHQPRNVEFSREKAFGILDAYGTSSTVGHVHTPTVGAFREFLEHHGFEVVDTVGLHPYQRGRLVALVDRAVSWRPSLCRRFAVLARLPVDE